MYNVPHLSLGATEASQDAGVRAAGNLLLPLPPSLRPSSAGSFQAALALPCAHPDLDPDPCCFLLAEAAAPLFLLPSSSGLEDPRTAASACLFRVDLHAAGAAVPAALLHPG